MKRLAPILAVVLISCGQSQPPEGRLFLGDSITKNWADARLASWSEVQAMFPGAVNAGYPGENAEQIEQHFRKLGMRPALVHILAGTNDDLRQTPLLPVETIERIAGNVESHGGKVIIGTIPPYDAGKFWQAAYAESYNARLKAMAAKHGYQVADYYGAMIQGDGKQRADLFLDGIHPNAEGYKVMGRVLAATLQPVSVAAKR